MLQKLKSLLADDAFFYSVLLILVAGASFGLGRQSVGGGDVVKNVENRASLAVLPPTPTGVLSTTTEPKVETSPSAPTQKTETVVVGSKAGSKYHLPTCSGAKRIKPENLITFDSIEAAKVAGYTPAANCKGLE